MKLHLSYLEFGEGESTSGTDAAVVPDGWAAHDRPQSVDRTGCNGDGFGLASVSAPLFACGLRVREYGAQVSPPTFRQT